MTVTGALLLALLPPATGDLPLGTWRGVVECPGGEIPFGLEFGKEHERLVALLVNGPEQRWIDRIDADGARVVVHLDPYDSRIEAQLVDRQLVGEWVRYRTRESETRLPFRATLEGTPRFAVRDVDPGLARELKGRWRVDFSSSDEDAVALFEVGAGGKVEGTFLTTLGDYRFLEGVYDGRRLQLSVFDGAHAFLFTAERQEDGSLAGDFWSRDSWHESWTAVKDPEAALPDPFGLTTWTGAVPLSQLAFPDLAGQRRALDDPAFAGKARLIVLFGSWCPNCYDETAYLVELQERFGERGLSILGLAFEFGDDLERQTRVLQRYVEHHGVGFPVLIAGTSDKAAASKAFPLLDRVRAYPTTIFLDWAGKVRAVHTGFSGPATEDEHVHLRGRFEGLIEELLEGAR